MFTKDDINRIIDLGHEAVEGRATATQKGELRAVLSKYSAGVQDLDWDGVMDVASFYVGVYLLAHGETSTLESP